MRARPEWIGKTDDEALPPWVFRRLWRKQEGRCGSCTRPLRPGHVTREHLKPIWAGGQNRESNVQLWCTVPCSSTKTPQEARSRAKGDRQFAAAHQKKKPKGRPLAGTKASGWKKKMDGSVERR